MNQHCISSQQEKKYHNCFCSTKMLKEFKEDMMIKYEMTDLGLLHHFLEI